MNETKETKVVYEDPAVVETLDSLAFTRRVNQLVENSLNILRKAGGVSPEEFRDRFVKSDPLPTEMETEDAWKAIKQHPNVYRRGSSYFFRFDDEPELKVGSKLWRHVTWVDHGLIRGYKIEGGVFLKGVRSFTAFASSKIWAGIWVVRPKKPGMTCFYDKPLPEKWTALEITGFSNNGRSAFVKPYVGPEDELLKVYWRPCSTCRVAKSPIAPCELCLKTENERLKKEIAELEAKRALESRGFVPGPKVENAPFVCRACNPKAPPGRGKCAFCKRTYA